MLAAGLDFGTSNSSLALYRNGRIELLELDPYNGLATVLPSLLYITRAQDHYVGRRAGDMYIELESGRPVYWERRKVGQTEVVVAGAAYWEDLFAEIDVSARGRLLQSIKTALRDPTYEGTQVFERYYKVDELISLLLRHLREQGERVSGAQVDQVVVGRPVKFSDNPVVDRRAQEKIELAARAAGFRDVAFELEPVAAAYAYHHRTMQREVALVFDFGGGTLDLTVVEVGGSVPPRILSTYGILLGGDDLDRALMRPLLRYFGEGSTVDGLPFPSNILGMLDSWQSMIELSRPQFRRVIRDARRHGSDPRAMAHLEALISKNLGFRLFQELERAKIELSSHPSTVIRFEADDIRIRERISRERFQDLIGAELQAVDMGLHEVVTLSGLQTTQITTVLRTGGSSAVPAFTHLLETRFGRSAIQELSRFTTIVGGLAIRAHSTFC